MAGFAIVALGPGLLAAVLRRSLGGALLPDAESAPASLWARDGLAGAYLLLYAAFVARHAGRKYSRGLYGAVCWANAALAAWLVAAAAAEATARGPAPELLLAAAALALPFALALCSSLAALGTLLRCAPGFLLFLPTFVAFFPAYAFARLHDLSWGNRPSGGAAASQTNADGGAAAEARDAERMARSLRRRAHLVCLLLVLANFAVAWSLAYEVPATDLVVLAALVLGIVLPQMALSLLFLIGYRIASAFGAVAHCCWTRVLRRSERDFYLPARPTNAAAPPPPAPAARA